jgi:hypothetical protein
MAKLTRKAGTTSQIIQVFASDLTSTSGAGKTGLLFNTATLICYYKRSSATASAAVTLATITTLGTFASGGFKEIDATNLPGMYEFHLPNAALASGADNVVFLFTGVANVFISPIEIELTATNNQDSLSGGMTAVNIATSQIAVKKNVALNNFAFLMVSSTDHTTPQTGLTVTPQRSIDGAAFGNCANAVSELGNGIYLINLANTDLNGTVITLKFTAASADNRYVVVVTQA